MNLVTILGLVAASLTTGSFLPQAIKAIKTKHTKDLSLGMYSVLTSGIVLWLIYGILVHDIPIIASNCVTLVFTSTILFLKLRYK
jgi:MtN3 and saliva related transmembrane protein